MDGLWKVVCAGGLLVGVVGCDTFSSGKKKDAWTSNLPPAPPPAANSSASGKSILVIEPEESDVKREGPLQSATLMAKAQMNVEMVAKDPNKSPADREYLLGEARRLYNEILQREPQHLDALIGLAQMYQVTGENEKLRDIEARMRERHGNNAKVWAWIAVRQGQAREWDNAAESYHQAVKLDPDNRLYRMHLGFTLARAGRYDEGYAWLSRCKREHEARHDLALMMMYNGHHDKARQQLEYAIQIEPNYKLAVNQLAALEAGNTTPMLPMPALDNPIRSAGHNEPVRPAVPTRPTMSTVDPLPVALPTDTRLPPAYTPTSGWDTTTPPRR